MGKLMNLKKLEKLKLYSLQLNIQQKDCWLYLLTTEGSDNFFNYYNFRTYEASVINNSTTN